MGNETSEMLSKELDSDDLNAIPADVAKKLENFMKNQQKTIQDKHDVNRKLVQIMREQAMKIEKYEQILQGLFDGHKLIVEKHLKEATQELKNHNAKIAIGNELQRKKMAISEVESYSSDEQKPAPTNTNSEQTSADLNQAFHKQTSINLNSDEGEPKLDDFVKNLEATRQLFKKIEYYVDLSQLKPALVLDSLAKKDDA